jgi:hypothetical protein
MRALPEERSEELSNASALDSRRQSLAGPDKPASGLRSCVLFKMFRMFKTPVNLSYANEALGLDE